MKSTWQTSLVFCLAIPLGLLAAGVRAEQNGTGRTVHPFNGKDLDGWKLKGRETSSHWTVGLARMDPDNPRALAVSPAGSQKGELVNAEAHGVDIYTAEKFGDATIRLEFMVPKGSNSGVYVMGEYEIQILDSFGKAEVGPGDLGGLYGAAAPKVNASLPPGQWQKMEIVFTAPRFDGDRKVANARFAKIVLNGKTIHENVEMQQQTPGGVTGKEVPAGPLMFQGNHGPVAYRNIEIAPAGQ